MKKHLGWCKDDMNTIDRTLAWALKMLPAVSSEIHLLYLAIPHLCVLWVFYYVSFDIKVLFDDRYEVSALIDKDKESGINFFDLASIRESCPILLSTFQKTMRFRAVNPRA